MDIADILEEGIAAKRAGNLEQAVRLYLQAQSMDPEDHRAYRNLAKLLTGAREYEDALKYWLVVCEKHRLKPTAMPLGAAEANVARFVRHSLELPGRMITADQIVAIVERRPCLVELLHCADDLTFFLGHCIVRLRPDLFAAYRLPEALMASLEEGLLGNLGGGNLRGSHFEHVFLISGLVFCDMNMRADMGNVAEAASIYLSPSFQMQCDLGEYGQSESSSQDEASNAVARESGVGAAAVAENAGDADRQADEKPTVEWAPGQVVLGEYLIEKELGKGKGGMGRVWLVKSNSTGRRFAVKQTIRKEEKDRKAFLAELQTWTDLPEHPNIVPCRFFRTVGDEIVIFTDFIEGGSLADWIAERKLTTLAQILDVSIQFAWGLHAIHERGLIHQDVKPGNVLMTADGVPMVADFGLTRARMRATDGSFDSPAMPPGQHSILVPGAGLMTKEYASPEQRAGQPLSRKTDIWSWGVSVLDMFMGGVSCRHGYIAAEVLQEFIECGQAEKDLPDMPEEVADILRRCFAHDPAERWKDLEEVATALVGVFQDATRRTYDRQPHHAAHPQAQYSVQHDRRVENVQWRDPREWLRLAYTAIGRDPTEANASQPPPAHSRKGAGVADLAIYEEAERLFLLAIQEGKAEIMELLAVFYGNKAILCRSLDDSMGALRAFDQCIMIQRQLAKHDARWEHANELAATLINKGNAIRVMGDLAGAGTLYDESISIYRRLVEKEGRRELANELAKALMNKAAVLRVMGDPAGAVLLVDEGLALLRQLVEREGRWELADEMAGALLSKANAVRAMADLKKAAALYDESIAIYRRLVEQDGRREFAASLAGSLMNKSALVSAMGNPAGAVGLVDDCTVLLRRLVDKEGWHELTQDLAKVLMNKAIMLGGMGDLSAAVTLHDESIAIYKKLVEQEGRYELANELAHALMNKAETFKVVGDSNSAVAVYDESIAIYKRLVPK